MPRERGLNPDGELWLRRVQRWVYFSAMLGSLFGRVVFLSKDPWVAKVPVLRIVMYALSICVVTLLAATLHNLNGRLFDIFGITAALWPVDYYILHKSIQQLDFDPELFELLVRVLLVFHILSVLFVGGLLAKSFKTKHGIYLGNALLFLFFSPAAAVATGIRIALELKYRKSRLLNTTDMLARARLGRGEYVVDYQVASAFYSQYSIIAALIGARIQDTELKSLVAALGVLTLPTLRSMGDGPQCFSFTAALTGVVEVKSVDELLIMTSTTRQQLLKALLKRGNRSASISQKNLSFARAYLRGALEMRRTFTTPELKAAGVKICRHVIKYPDGVRWAVSTTDSSLLHVHRNQFDDMGDDHDIDKCLLGEDLVLHRNQLDDMGDDHDTDACLLDEDLVLYVEGTADSTAGVDQL